MTPVRLELAALRSRVKHSTTEPMRSLLVSALRVVSAAIRSKVVVLLLLIHCLCFLCDFVPCLVMQYFAPCLTLQSSR